MAAVEHGHDRRDHLVLAAGQWQVRRHQSAKSRKRVMKRVRNQTVRRNDLRGLAVGRGMDRDRILYRIQIALRFDGATHVLIVIN